MCRAADEPGGPRRCPGHARADYDRVREQHARMERQAAELTQRLDTARAPNQSERAFRSVPQGGDDCSPSGLRMTRLDQDTPTQTSSRASAGTGPPCSAARRWLTLSPGSVLLPHRLRHSVAATSTRCRCGRVIVPCSEKAGYDTGGHGQRSASEARVPWQKLRRPLTAPSPLWVPRDEGELGSAASNGLSSSRTIATANVS
jgi:hypothetical protein